MVATINYFWNITQLIHNPLIWTPIIFTNQDLSPQKGKLSIDLIISLNIFEDVGPSAFIIYKTSWAYLKQPVLFRPNWVWFMPSALQGVMNK